MVQVASSMGRSKKPFVDVEVKGIAEVQRYLQQTGKYIEAGADAGVAKGANLVQQEVQESIIGNRSETKSVDTGNFGNSIHVDKVDTAVFKIFPQGIYPNGTTVEEVATWLEYGTEKITERRHFRNSMARKENEVKEIIAREVRNATRQ